MKRMWMLVFVLVAMMVVAGCYHAVVTTGNAPGTMEVYKPFASCWIYGLVPPNVVAVASECPNGVARVETKLGFVNQLVGIITLGIYTPMNIRVTCAESSTALGYDGDTDLTVADANDEDEVAAVFSQAAALAVKEHRPVFVGFSTSD